MTIARRLHDPSEIQGFRVRVEGFRGSGVQCLEV